MMAEGANLFEDGGELDSVFKDEGGNFVAFPLDIDDDEDLIQAKEAEFQEANGDDDLLALFPETTMREDEPFAFPAASGTVKESAKEAVVVPVAENASASTEVVKPKRGKGAPTAAQKVLDDCKKRAQQVATSSADQRRDRKRVAEGDDKESDSKRAKIEDFSSDDGNADPETLKQKRHQRRLEKNRDTAYISRIRRRVYTKELEASLVRAETSKAEAESRNRNLTDELEKLRAEMATLKKAAAAPGTRGPASSSAPSDGSAVTPAVANSSRSEASSIPSESEPEMPETRSDAGSGGSMFFADLFQDLIAPITPVGNNANVGMTLFVFVLLFGMFVPGTDHHRAGYSNRLPLKMVSPSVGGSNKLGGGEVWDPTSVLKLEPEMVMSASAPKAHSEVVAGSSAAGASSSGARASGSASDVAGVGRCVSKEELVTEELVTEKLVKEELEMETAEPPKGSPAALPVSEAGPSSSAQGESSSSKSARCVPIQGGGVHKSVQSPTASQEPARVSA